MYPPVKNTPNREADLNNASSRSDSNQKGYLYRPKEVPIRTRNHRPNTTPVKR